MDTGGSLFLACMLVLSQTDRWACKAIQASKTAKSLVFLVIIALVSDILAKFADGLASPSIDILEK